MIADKIWKFTNEVTVRLVPHSTHTSFPDKTHIIGHMCNKKVIPSESSETHCELDWLVNLIFKRQRMTSKRGVGISNWICKGKVMWLVNLPAPSASPERFFSIVELVRFVKTNLWGSLLDIHTSYSLTDSPIQVHKLPCGTHSNILALLLHLQHLIPAPSLPTINQLLINALC